ncbi:putative chromatin assembly factor 1 subunit a protein [Rosellinia necatrix]|uniref:Putative chromatin assembly factor 1 subunit a protein n=1 Tax=Rosellinia necatrix TaxID=77044 RepID=A0A1W2THM5_ROSNE|nr:putative chromatin assembly factor 1 subunit a protein [Rosellinia necatrix]
MPLFSLSPNLKSSPVVARERLQNRFGNAIGAASLPASIDALDCENPSVQKSPTMLTSTVECQPQPSSMPTIATGSPPGGSPAGLTKAGSSTPARDSLSPHITPSKMPQPCKPPSTSFAQQLAHPNLPVPASKRKRTVTVDEKGLAEKKQKQDDAATEKARIAAEKAAEREAIKMTKAAEKARADAEKEAARVAKAAEKAKVDAAKEAKRQKKQEEELAAKAKKEKQQNLMASFLKKVPTTPSKMSDRPATTVMIDTASPTKQKVEVTKSAYELNFKPFFIKPGVTMAATLFEMDSETKEAKSAILDEYMSGIRGEFTPKRPFDAAGTFQFAFPQQRGIIPPSVKKIMETIHGDPYQNIFGTTSSKSESQTEKLLVNAQDQLSAVPMKYIRFYEDVRPAYCGTVTTPITSHTLRVLSRRPVSRTMPLAYDYDSEAEWVEDDGEDLDDAEDEEEDLEPDEEMDDFVDDSEAVPTIIRPGFETDSLPVSTGLCFEDRTRLGHAAVQNYRLEFILDSLEHHPTINPFSTEYWPAPVKKPAAVPTILSTPGTITSMLPPAAPRHPATSLDLKDGVPQNILEDFKRALLSDECKDYSKATVIEMLAKRFTSCTKAQVKVTLDTIAHRVTPADATKKSVKRWALLPAFSLK